MSNFSIHINFLAIHIIIPNSIKMTVVHSLVVCDNVKSTIHAQNIDC